MFILCTSCWVSRGGSHLFLACPPCIGQTCVSYFRFPMILAGDANVWHPHVDLGPVLSDALIIPFIDVFISSCGLRLCNPRGEATHIAGAALDLFFISSTCREDLSVHNGVSRSDAVPSCCPLLGSDHFLCVSETHLAISSLLEAGPCLPSLRKLVSYFVSRVFSPSWSGAGVFVVSFTRLLPTMKHAGLGFSGRNV